MFKSILKFILKSRGIVRKLELDLKDIHVSDFLSEKDKDDDLHIIAANLK